MEKINYEFYLEKYLDDDLTPSERKWLEKELDGNDQLKSELEFRREVNRMLKDQEMFHLTSSLENAYEDYQKDESHKPFLSSRVKQKLIAIASVAAFVVISVLLYLNNYKPLDKQELYTMYFEPYEATLFRSSSENVDQILREAMQQYENQNYSQAIIWFERVLENDSLNVPTHFYSGISHMEIEEYREANESFNVVIDQKNNLFVEQAEWYLGFCYLMTDQTKKAKLQFKSIANSDGYYQKKASKVLRRIR